MIKLAKFIIIFFLTMNYEAFAQSADSLRYKIQQIVLNKNAIVGVSIAGTDGKELISLNAERHYPLQSVFKFHIALVVLSQIDKGKFSLDQKIEIQKNELLPDLWSPLRTENPNGGSFPISKIIEYTVSKSDNVGCDALLRLLGGTKVVNDYFKKMGFKDISIKLNEEVMQSNWDLMFQNWTTPKAANATLVKFYSNKKKLLSQKSYDFLWQVMKETTTGMGRLKGKLPAGTIVAHKTGSSGVNKEGLTAAVNDIGIIFLPNGKYFFISIFVTNSKENEATNEEIIADIAKATWDYYTNRSR